ncbi:MAG: hypothetical protein CMH63_02825 [Nanoarchaeota archaeon]|nr:hypothetical protein [Nanoarchaeota archaeon]|tara:strand:- start:7447 stop:7872 length:426 start_codon:yes stop_codon:yes gene_type:complete
MKSSKKDNSILFLFTIVALFVIALVGFNFENMTAGAIRFGRTTIDVSPKFVNAGENINIQVNPGRGCVNRFIGIYDDSELRRATTQYRGGTMRKVCEPFTARYKTMSSWMPQEDESGIFFVKVFDYGKEEFIKTSFTINGG